jgi:hypothetical protein
MENTRSSPRKNMKDSELSGVTRARQSPLGSAAERGALRRPPSTAAVIESDHASRRRMGGRAAQRVLRFRAGIAILVGRLFVGGFGFHDSIGSHCAERFADLQDVGLPRIIHGP